MKKSGCIAALLLSTALAAGAERGPVPGEPRIIVLPPQRVLVTDAQGDPNAVAGPAFRSLFRAFYANADTAEILHVGPYSEEDADIAALKSFIARNGFAIRGSHEEVYLLGPGMLFKGHPRKYRTLIRYTVERVGEAPRPVAVKRAEQAK
jgi:hypothetical protein